MPRTGRGVPTLIFVCCNPRDAIARCTWVGSMNAIIGMTALAVAPTAGVWYAADNKQRTKLVECNKQAADRKGDERKAFMKE